MFNFDKSSIQRFALASVGAIALSAACVLGAVGPAMAASPAGDVAAWQAKVANQLDGTQAAADAAGSVRSVTLAARFTADGDYAGAELARSSGDPRLDRQAVAIARGVAYPRLPESRRGAAQTVTVKLYFGNDTRQIARAIRKDTVQVARNDVAGTQFAAR